MDADQKGRDELDDDQANLPLWFPVDIIEVQPQGQFVQNQRGRNAVPQSQEVAPPGKLVGHGQVTDAEQKQDTPNIVVNMQIPKPHTAQDWEQAIAKAVRDEAQHKHCHNE